MFWNTWRFLGANSLKKALSGLLMSILCYGNINAQVINAKANVDTTGIRIGEQFILSLELTHPADVRVDWPAVQDTFSNLEVVRKSEVDTSNNPSERSVTRQQHFVITSFDSGYHVIPPFVFRYKVPGEPDSVDAATEPLLISVAGIAVDTTRAIKDIKGQVQIPFSIQDLLIYFVIVAGIILVLLTVWYFYKKYFRKTPPLQPALPIRPAHEIALEALQNLAERKLWQQGKYKLYYSELSDIIRLFIENRWNINAPEMTTGEILQLGKISGQSQDIYHNLKQMLELSDLVKFAKATPIGPENEQSMQSAVDFVKVNIENPQPELRAQPETER